MEVLDSIAVLPAAPLTGRVSNHRASIFGDENGALLFGIRL
jgi:hypothetical protein